MPEKHLPSTFKTEIPDYIHMGEIDLKSHHLIFHSHVHFTRRRNENCWEPHCPIKEYIPAKIDKK